MTPGANDGKVSVLFVRTQRLLDSVRRDSLWCLDVDTACCGLGTSTGGTSTDVLPCVAPRQADVMVVAGSVNAKMAHELRALYDEMPHPKWVVAVGECACDGGPFREYPNVVAGIRGIVPVDVRVPGCPPAPDAVRAGLAELRDRISRRAEERIAARRG